MQACDSSNFARVSVDSRPRDVLRLKGGADNEENPPHLCPSPQLNSSSTSSSSSSSHATDESFNFEVHCRILEAHELSRQLWAKVSVQRITSYEKFVLQSPSFLTPEELEMAQRTDVKDIMQEFFTAYRKTCRHKSKKEKKNKNSILMKTLKKNHLNSQKEPQ